MRDEGIWNTLEASQKAELVREGRTPPRFERQPGADIGTRPQYGRRLQVKEVLMVEKRGARSGSGDPRTLGPECKTEPVASRERKDEIERQWRKETDDPDDSCKGWDRVRTTAIQDRRNGEWSSFWSRIG